MWTKQYTWELGWKSSKTLHVGIRHSIDVALHKAVNWFNVWVRMWNTIWRRGGREEVEGGLTRRHCHIHCDSRWLLCWQTHDAARAMQRLMLSNFQLLLLAIQIMKLLWALRVRLQWWCPTKLLYLSTLWSHFQDQILTFSLCHTNLNTNSFTFLSRSFCRIGLTYSEVAPMTLTLALDNSCLLLVFWHSFAKIDFLSGSVTWLLSGHVGHLNPQTWHIRLTLLCQLLTRTGYPGFLCNKAVWVILLVLVSILIPLRDNELLDYF